MSEKNINNNFETLWTGRVDNQEAFVDAARLHQIIAPFNQHSRGVAVIGFCSEEGVARNKGRVGAASAPALLRKSLANLPWNTQQQVFDAGDIHCTNNDLESAQQLLADRVQQTLQQNCLPFVLGGGHEVAFGSWLGLMQHVEEKQAIDATTAAKPRIGIINFDAHFDLRIDTEGASSGTPFYQIAKQCEDRGYAFNYCCLGVSEMANTAALFKRADALNVSYRYDTQMHSAQLAQTRAQLQQFIDDCDYVYLTIDLDVLPAHVAPGVSAPASLGVELSVLESLIAQIKISDKLVLADIAEYNPNFDIDQRTARVAARLFYNIVKE